MYRGQWDGPALAGEGGVPVPAGHLAHHPGHAGHLLLPGCYQGIVEVCKVGFIRVVLDSLIIISRNAEMIYLQAV